MSPGEVRCTVETLLRELGPAARLLTADQSSLGRPITHAEMWFDGDAVPTSMHTLLVCPRLDVFDMSATSSSLLAGQSRLLAVPLGDEPDQLEQFAALHGHVIIGLSASVNLAEVVTVVARTTRPAEEQVSRRLLTLQRSLSQALAEPSPTIALLAHLQRTCRATVALIDLDGNVVHATGPLPLALLQHQLTSAVSSTVLDVDGWRGTAQLVEDSVDGPFGWLVVAARRKSFPDPFVQAAAAIAATLVETAHTIAVAERNQDVAVRASVFEQLLALRVSRDDPELLGRVSGLGVRFDDDLRVLVAEPTGTVPPDRMHAAVTELGITLRRVLRSAGVREFLTLRDDHVAVLAQCSPATARRVLIASGAAEVARVGAGRRVVTVGDVVDSYHDAHLALRSLQRGPRRSGFVSFEDFDFATRLFSNVGLENMVEWAHEFLRPLNGRLALVSALQAYFAHGLNIKAAANELFVHHNSLRYRLAKVEELLGVSLTDPAAISSAYLALTALDLVDDQSAASPVAAARVVPAVHDVERSDPVDDFARTTSELGVAFAPER